MLAAQSAADLEVTLAAARSTYEVACATSSPGCASQGQSPRRSPGRSSRHGARHHRLSPPLPERQSAGSQAVVFMGLEPGRSLMVGLRDSHQRDPYCDATNECEKQRPLNQNMLFPRDSRHCDELIG